MSTGTSSLRQTERRRGVCASACAATLALALAGPSFAASAPAPDNPPTGPRSEASPRIASAPTAAPPATGGTAAATPSPDAPLVAKAPAAPDPGTAKTPASNGRTPSPTHTAAATPAPATARPASSPTGTSGVVASRVRPKPKAGAHASQTVRHKHPTVAAEPTRVGRPHDGSRLGLPAGTVAALAAVAGDSGRTALLAAAALLLGAAAAGGLVVGVAGRRLARIT